MADDLSNSEGHKHFKPSLKVINFRYEPIMDVCLEVALNQFIPAPGMFPKIGVFGGIIK